MGGYDAVHDGWEILDFECKFMIVFNADTYLVGTFGSCMQGGVTLDMEQAMFMYHTIS